ncbi:unnamed protein product [Rhizophagus irregularis]|uniref:Uncharacterized protein n=1 Tax=Rhizophagus irregularis TaxID=588596 RepID=A0A916EF56_9GLOM|nr:unnamed protein product [Rhizophagus irregularis]
MDEKDILKKRNDHTMDEEMDIYRFWKTRNKTYCSDEQEMYVGYSKSKKLTIFDHYIGKYVVFDSLDAYWEMADSTPKEYQCYEEVVFNEVPQSPVIEISISSATRYPGTKIVEILRTTLGTMLAIFRTDYTDYTNIARVPSTLDDFVVMDEIVQKDGTWHYFFHIQATSFYFPNYSYCEDFRERLCDSLPNDISLLITRPTIYIYQLVGISGSYLLSLDNHKRITLYSQFLGTSTSVNRNDLFVSRYSAMHDPSTYAPLCRKNIEQRCFANPISASEEVIPSKVLTEINAEHNEVGIHISNVSIVSTEQVGMNKKTFREQSSIGDSPKADEPSTEFSEKNIANNRKQSLILSSTSYPKGSATTSCSTILIRESSTKKFQSRVVDPNLLAICAAINCMAVMFIIYKRMELQCLREVPSSSENIHQGIGTVFKYEQSDKVISSSPYGRSFRIKTITNKKRRRRKNTCNSLLRNKRVGRSASNRPKLLVKLKKYPQPRDNRVNRKPYFTDRRYASPQIGCLIVNNQWDNMRRATQFRYGHGFYFIPLLDSYYVWRNRFVKRIPSGVPRRLLYSTWKVLSRTRRGGKDPAPRIDYVRLLVCPMKLYRNEFRINPP